MLTLSHRRREEGFTLLELTLVMVVFALLMVSGLHWPTAMTLWPAADQVARDVRLTQAMAMNRTGAFTWRRTGTTGYAIQDGVGTTLVSNRVEGVSLGGVEMLTFGTRGIPATGGSVTLDAEGERVSVVVAAGTGEVRIQQE